MGEEALMMQEISTTKEFTLDEEFEFMGEPGVALKIGDVVKIKRFGYMPFYGKARVTDVLAENDYKAIVIAVKL